mmetsp:Transcript_57783/g.154050  ORF Transcript_57783/g.154050 Transcript_57783/m.154050 type:complete len:258 (+) Transcript_57783:230-1003(+)
MESVPNFPSNFPKIAVSRPTINLVSSSSPCIRKSWSIRVLSIASLTKMALITFNTAKTVITTNNMYRTAYPTDISRRSLSTSHQSNPPATDMNMVTMVINREPKNTLSSSTTESSAPLSDMCCDAAFKNTTEKREITMNNTKTAHMSIILQFWIAKVIILSFRMRCVYRMIRSMRRERTILKKRMTRIKLAFKPPLDKSISVTERVTSAVSNKFHRHSMPTQKRPSRQMIRSTSSKTKIRLNVTSKATIQLDLVMSA